MLDLNYVRMLCSMFARRVARTEEGASMVEYALLLALIAVVCIGAVTILGRSASDKFTDVGNSVSGA
ncbi:MAG TPA: Flp family type IVb pilin [Acidimicrobiales bacterium]|jgi:pilus assembly protein Flp/PilA|nr:Flp family type IVb pilin [Acidimicrobiales bacterium]